MPSRIAVKTLAMRCALSRPARAAWAASRRVHSVPTHGLKRAGECWQHHKPNGNHEHARALARQVAGSGGRPVRLGPHGESGGTDGDQRRRPHHLEGQPI